MRTLIFANGDLRAPHNIKELLVPTKQVIAVDGGARHCQTLGIKPDVLIGDFDSLEEKEVLRLEEDGVKIVRHPARKDATDLELAVNYAIEQGAREIIILGAIGDRFDHSLTNIFLATQNRFLDCPIKFLYGDEEIFLLCEGLNTINGHAGDIVSLIPLSDVSSITTEGLEYPLSNENLHAGTSRGMSNVIVDSSVRVSFVSGMLLCIIRHSKDAA